MATLRGTTPTFSITLNGIDLSRNYRVYVTIDQNGTQLTKDSVKDVLMVRVTRIDNDDDTVSTQIDVNLTQSETLRFEVGNADIQAKWIDETDVVEASDISQITFSRALLEDVIQS